MKHLQTFESFINADGQLQDFQNDMDFEDLREIDKLNGKYLKADAEINTHRQTISIGRNFYLDGHEAMEVINQIYDIWMEEMCEPDDAVMLWYDYNV
jgi:hypothetical protein